MKHYLYRVTDKELKDYYYGIRTSKKTNLEDDFWSYCTSSSRHLEIKKFKKKRFSVKIIKIKNTRKEILEEEIKYHNRLNVGANPKFFNKIKQSSKGFDATGKTVYKDEKGNKYFLEKDNNKIKVLGLLTYSKNIISGVCIKNRIFITYEKEEAKESYVGIRRKILVENKVTKEQEYIESRFFVKNSKYVNFRVLSIERQKLVYDISIGQNIYVEAKIKNKNFLNLDK